MCGSRVAATVGTHEIDSELGGGGIWRSGAGGIANVLGKVVTLSRRRLSKL